MAAIQSADPDRGPASAALRRLLSASWEQLGRHEELAQAAGAGLSADAMRRSHEAARSVIGRLVERGQREGAFRTDLPTSLLVTSCLALIHAAAEATRAGELDPQAAVDGLSVLLSDLFVRRDARVDRVD
jgi:hypothetical protein